MPTSLELHEPHGLNAQDLTQEQHPAVSSHEGPSSIPSPSPSPANDAGSSDSRKDIITTASDGTFSSAPNTTVAKDSQRADSVESATLPGKYAPAAKVVLSKLSVSQRPCDRHVGTIYLERY